MQPWTCLERSTAVGQQLLALFSLQPLFDCFQPHLLAVSTPAAWSIKVYECSTSNAKPCGTHPCLQPLLVLWWGVDTTRQSINARRVGSNWTTGRKLLHVLHPIN